MWAEYITTVEYGLPRFPGPQFANQDWFHYLQGQTNDRQKFTQTILELKGAWNSRCAQHSSDLHSLSECSLYGLKWTSRVLTAIHKMATHSHRIFKCIAKRNFSRAVYGILVGFPESHLEDTDVFCLFMREWLHIFSCLLAPNSTQELKCRPLVTQYEYRQSNAPIFKIQQLAAAMLKQSVKRELFYNLCKPLSIANGMETFPEFRVIPEKATSEFKRQSNLEATRYTSETIENLCNLIPLMHNLVRNKEFLMNGIVLPKDEFLSGIVSVFKNSSAILKGQETGFQNVFGDSAKRCKLALELAILSLSEIRDLFVDD